MTMTSRSTPLAASGTVLFLMACGSDGADATAPVTSEGGALGAAYLVLSDVPTADSSQLYLTVVPGAHGQSVDQSRGIELPRRSQAFADQGYVFVANGETFALT